MCGTGSVCLFFTGLSKRDSLLGIFLRSVFICASLTPFVGVDWGIGEASLLALAAKVRAKALISE
jgi:hypothetical protein